MLFVTLMAVIMSVMAEPVVTSRSQVRSIFNKLVKANPIEEPVLLVFESTGKGGTALDNSGQYEIYFDTDNFPLRLTESAVAALLGHELTHIVEGDVETPTRSMKQEERADIKGVTKAEKAGYPYAACGAAEMYLQSVGKYGAFKNSTDGIHPSDLIRYGYFKSLCEKEKLDKPKQP
jgi:hypothetical protein